MTVTRAGVTVRAPKNCSQKVVQQFIDAKQSRIRKQRAKLQKQAEISTIEYDDNGVPLAFQHLGKQLPIYLRAHDKNRPLIEAHDGSVTAVIPSDRINNLPQHKERITCILERWQRREAHEYLTKRTQLLNDELGLNVGKIIIKVYKRKYGQCKGNDISLDWKLIRFPIAISDHIIYHELAHLTHKHHQQSFWNLLEQYDPATPTHKKRLKENGPAMHTDW